ncbi:MAG TPA: CAP domain-containing protein [Patescibacteria group bacterium]|nr:CAP domain-containing protein [Patescibacteria group bacterium]
MFDLINRDRLNPANARGLHPLRWNQKLAAIARAHSLDMIRQGYFGHVAPDGKSIVDRLNSAGIAWQAEGENIAIASSVAEAEANFMNEPRFQHNHRWNILNPNYTNVGVGIVAGPHGEYYITQDFTKSKTGR